MLELHKQERLQAGKFASSTLVSGGVMNEQLQCLCVPMRMNTSGLVVNWHRGKQWNHVLSPSEVIHVLPRLFHLFQFRNFYLSEKKYKLWKQEVIYNAHYHLCY